MFWETVPVKYKFARELSQNRQQLLLQNHITITHSIDFDSGIDDYHAV